jgi:hypothetical protein
MLNWVALLCALLLFPLAVHSQEKATRNRLALPAADEPIEIIADELTWDTPKNLLQLDGHVVVLHPEYRVEADRAEADLTTRTIRLSGHVVITSLKGGEDRILTGGEAEINTATGAGLLLTGRVSVPWDKTRIQLQGDRLERIDEKTYRVDRGSVTWCNCGENGVPDWSVSADHLEVDTDEQVKATGARVQIRNHPVFAAPSLRLPLGTGRQSGFLIPIIETNSGDGIQVELPFYLVLGRSADLTLGPRWIQERGVEVGVAGRYDYGHPGKGELRGSVIEDSKENAWRGGARWTHRADAGDRVSLAVDAAYITDNQVLFDFDHRQLGDENQRNLESRLYLALHGQTMNLTTEAAAFDDLVGDDLRRSALGPDRDPQMIQRLPAVSYTLLTRPIAGPLAFDVSAYAANYYRQDADLGKGQLYSLFPRLVISSRLFDAMDFWMAGGYRGWYLMPAPEIEGVDLTTGRAEAELYLSSDWERVFESGDRRFRNAVRPEIVAFYGDSPRPPEDIFFAGIIPAGKTELAGMHLDSRLWSRPLSAPGPIVETGRIELTQLYDFAAQEWRDLRVEARLGQPTPWAISLDAFYSWEDWQWTRAVALVGYQFPFGLELNAGYRLDTGKVRSPYFDFEVAENRSVTGSIIYKPNDRHRVEYRAYYSLQYGQMVRQSFNYGYLARQRCWGVDLMASDRIRPLEPDKHVLSGSVNVRIASPATP